MDRVTFLDNLARSGLLPAPQLAEIAYRVSGDNGTALARRLVNAGTITRFQAERLLEGQATGFRLANYRILDILGSGSLGRVYKAFDDTHRRCVALKVIDESLKHDRHLVGLFDREARALCRLQHPNIIWCYETGSDGTTDFVALEYVNGPSLKGVLDVERMLPVDFVLELGLQVARALAHVHKQNMLHRDLKPSNLLLAPTVERATYVLGQPFKIKLVDFGLVRLRGVSLWNPEESTLDTAMGGIFGTPDYLSPEQARDVHSADPRSDLYGLGCTLYHALAGQPPFPGDNAMEKLIKHLADDPAPLARFRGDVPSGLDFTIRKLMAKDPDCRIESADELLVILADLQQQHSVKTFTPHPAETKLELQTGTGTDVGTGRGW